jgi:3-deoxy-D-manno-octulosonate 8-phosphate phosphatase (KDO 8-P phosphatase)
MKNHRLEQVRLLLLDVDGVLTAGEIVYSDSGEQLKFFNVRDGLGIRLLEDAEIKVGIVTGRGGRALRHRCDNLGIDLIFEGTRDKARVLPEIEKKTGVAADRTGFMGDDLPDLPIMRRVGLAIAVADAHPLVKTAAHIVTQAPGGRGAVREACEMILKAQKRWDDLMEKHFDG